MASAWKQTIDGQWQLFSNLADAASIKEGVYKPSARTPADGKLEETPLK